MRPAASRVDCVTSGSCCFCCDVPGGRDCCTSVWMGEVGLEGHTVYAGKLPQLPLMRQLVLLGPCPCPFLAGRGEVGDGPCVALDPSPPPAQALAGTQVQGHSCVNVTATLWLAHLFI
jgi:hypothetical protein